MREKTPIEIREAELWKVQRKLIRLKHSLAADEELLELAERANEVGVEAAMRERQ